MWLLLLPTVKSFLEQLIMHLTNKSVIISVTSFATCIRNTLEALISIRLIEFLKFDCPGVGDVYIDSWVIISAVKSFAIEFRDSCILDS